MNSGRVDGEVVQLVSRAIHFLSQKFQVEIHKVAHQHRILNETA